MKESRILANSTGFWSRYPPSPSGWAADFTTIAPTGRARPELQQATPMTLAETASIMCETIVNNAVLEKATDRQEQLAILENALINDSQVIVDIYSRYLFEKELMERRERSELSADELCDIMERAQAAAYGDGLDERYRHRYMWTWKPHYYFAGLDFYNFPYAFGLLFGTGLYALSRSRGPAFVAEYEKLLASTGEATAADLAARFGIDIRTRAFWDQSLGIIGERIERYCSIPHVTVSAPVAVLNGPDERGDRGALNSRQLRRACRDHDLGRKPLEEEGAQYTGPALHHDRVDALRPERLQHLPKVQAVRGSIDHEKPRPGDELPGRRPGSPRRGRSRGFDLPSARDARPGGSGAVNRG